MRKPLLKSLQISLASLLILFVLAFVLLQTSPVKSLVLNLLLKDVNKKMEVNLKVGGVQGLFPFSLSLTEVAVYEKEILLAKANQVSLNWSVFKFLIEHAIFATVNAEGLELLNLPSKLQAAHRDHQPLQWPSNPFHFISINLSCKNTLISQKVNYYKDLVFDLTSAFTFYGKEGNFSWHNLLKNQDYPGSNLDILFHGNHPRQEVSAKIIHKEPTQGLTAHILNTDLLPEYELHAHMIGSWYQWQRLISNSPIHLEPAIQGQVNVQFRNDAAKENPFIKAVIGEESAEINSLFEMVFFDFYKFYDLTLQGRNGSITGSLSLDPNFILTSGHLDISIADLKPISDIYHVPLTGPLDLHVNLLDSILHPSFNFDAYSNQLFLNQYMISDLKITFKNEPTNHGISGQLTLESSIEGNFLSFASKCRFQNNEIIQFFDILAELQTAKISGNLDLLLDGGYLNGSLQFYSSRLADLTFLLRHQIDGEGQAKIDLDSVIRQNKRQQRASISTYVKDFQAQDVQVKKLHANVHFTSSHSYVFNDLRGKMDLSGHDITYHQLSFETAHISTHVKEHQITFKIDGNGHYKDPLSVTARGIFHPLKQGWNLKLSQLKGHALQEYFYLEEPTSITYHDKQISFKKIDFHFGEGVLSLSKYTADELATFHAYIKNLPLEYVTLFYPDHPLKGRLNLKGEFQNLDKNPSGHLKIKLNDLKILDTSDDIAPLNGFVEAKLDQGNLLLISNFSDHTNQFLKLRMDLPVDATLNPVHFKIKPDTSLYLNLNYNGDIGPAWQFLIPDNNLILGKIRIDLKVSGTLNDPICKGFLSLNNGTFDNINTGIVLHDIDLSMEGDQKHLILKHFIATDGDKGKVTSSGWLDFKAKEFFPYSLDFNIDNAKLLHLDYISSSFNGKATFSGNFKEGLLKGDLEITKTEALIPNAISNPLPKMNLKFINMAPLSDCSKYEVKQRITFPIHFDLNLNIPKYAFLRGRGIDSIWKGNVKVSGTDLNPSILGQLELVRGNFFFIGKTMTFTEGAITFNGDPVKETFIHLIAEIDLPDLKVHAALNGPLESPKLTFYSDPPLQQHEILSLLLFDQNLDELTPFQALILAKTVAALSGSYQGPDLVDRLRRGIGLDQLNITTNEQDLQKINILFGKYITPNILVTINQGLTYQSETDVSAHIKYGFQVQAKVGYAMISELLLLWKLQY